MIFKFKMRAELTSIAVVNTCLFVIIIIIISISAFKLIKLTNLFSIKKFNFVNFKRNTKK